MGRSWGTRVAMIRGFGKSHPKLFIAHKRWNPQTRAMEDHLSLEADHIRSERDTLLKVDYNFVNTLTGKAKEHADFLLMNRAQILNNNE